MTLKQKLLALKLVENGGNIGKAMTAAGYSPAMAKNPQKVTNSKGFKKLMERILPDKKLLNLQNQLLDSVQVASYRFPATLSDQEIESIIESAPEAKVMYIKHENGFKNCLYSLPDNRARLNALELAYKLHGYDKRPNRQAENENVETGSEIKRVRELLASTV